MSSVFGIVAAISAPLVGTIGLIFYENWNSSAFNLNVFKNTLGSFLFLIVSIAISNLSNLTQTKWLNIVMLILSSFIGIIIGDTLWLASLRMIESRRLIIVDALKPFMGAGLAYFILGESIEILGLVGMFITIAGVVITAMELNREPEEECKRKSQSCESVNMGYFLAFLNVTFDALGMLITKYYGGKPLNTFDINVVRFGSAAGLMVFSRSMLSIARLTNVSFIPHIFSNDWDKNKNSSNSHNGNYDNNNYGNYIDTQKIDGDDGNSIFMLPCYICIDDDTTTNTASTNTFTTATTVITIISKLDTEFILNMTYKQFLLVVCGVILCTFTCPSLINYALFELHPIAVVMTLTSLGPIFSLPLTYFIKGEEITNKSIMSSLMAVGGVVLLVWSV